MQLGFAAFGKWGQVMVDVSLVLSQLSFCCSYFIFIMLNIPSIAPLPARGSTAEYLLSPDVLIALQVCVDSPAFAAAFRYMVMVPSLALVRSRCWWRTLKLVLLVMGVLVRSFDGYVCVLVRAGRFVC